MGSTLTATNLFTHRGFDYVSRKSNVKRLLLNNSITIRAVLNDGTYRGKSDPSIREQQSDPKTR
ncbi:hypothetical protein QP759_00540 [Actinomycetaceae bacterium UMB8039B]|uniref:hypothetical protein n=1 Tax=Pauljensenia sp. UMB8040A TaxID=3046343 RepID=UPI00254E5B6D|nr:hypothetical protein [Pauljensenia sp. UMB8040A]MDK7780547.1 hypothetical protein [Actinomycetaceae bacterium UMB8041B]MDK8293010.1 hypothetical protein [Actinomycetaceae bacterium UMB8039B]MDK8607907.1 hypothetical protein [Actinomycetaceae bacterium UMB8041A]MDK8752404.1 hypothetical protein [Actinomycetaceae bacterium UMB8039A]MDK6829640.1 hypothetical protein [Pauljensenia sp. UMB8040A]